MPEHKMKVEKGIAVTMRDGVRISLCVYRPDAAGRFPGAVRGLALPVRDGRGAGLSAVPVARDRPGRMVCRPGLRLCPRRRARLRPFRRRIRVHGAQRAAGLSRADRLDHQAGLEQRPRRRHRPVVLRDGAMADGDLQPAGARLHRALRRPRRSVSRLELPRRHLLQLPLGLVHEPARRQPAPPGRPARPAADDVRSRRRHHRPLARRRILARALALLAARQDQVPGAVDRALGQDGPAPARQHPRLRGGQGAEEARGHRRAQHVRSAPDVRPGRIPREGAAAVLRPPSQGQEQRLHGGGAGEAVRARRQCLARGGGMAAAARDPRRLLSAQGSVGQRHLAQRRRAVDREAGGGRARPRATPIRTGNGSTASRSSARTGGWTRSGAC